MNTKAKSMLSIIAYAKGSEGISIIEVASEVYRLLKRLGEVDPIFLQPVHFNGSRDKLLDLTAYGEIDIAKMILDTYWSEITEYEFETKPTIYHRRINDGFSFNAKFLKSGQTMFYLNIGIGYKYDGITISEFNKDVYYSYSWYKDVLYKIVESITSFFATVKINNQPFNLFYNEHKIKFPIGWITYFSNEFEPSIPNDLQEVRYEQVQNGNFLYTSDKDFLKDKEAYFGYKEKLNRIIDEIKTRVPEYSK